MLERADEVFYELGEVLAATRPPRELFAEHMHVCFMRDEVALNSLDIIGEDNIMWEVDYPHESGLFPTATTPWPKPSRRCPTTRL